jgi:membrane-associated phospholipid phosphatase
MKKIFSLLLVLSSVSYSGFGQYNGGGANDKSDKVYKTSWADGAIFAAGAGLSYWGLTKLNNKDGVPEAELARFQNDPAYLQSQIDDINGFDRWAAGNYNERWISFSDIPFYGSFATPLLYLTNKRTRRDFGQIGLLYLETMSIAGAMFTQAAGNTNRRRPLVYNTDPENKDDSQRNAENSFFGGHPTATAAAAFFTAKVFNDYFPNSRAKPWVWVGAGVVSGSVAAGRLIGGKHFPTDNLIGLAVGTSVGILVPHFHKISNDRLSMAPFGFGDAAGLNVRYQF